MDLFTYLEDIPDHRQATNMKHNLIDVVFLVFSAVLSGANGWKEIQNFGDAQIEWLKKYRSFENGIPRRHCIAMIVKALDTEALMQALLSWINVRRESSGKARIAIDGKTLRGAWKGDIYNAIHVVSAYDVENGITLAQSSSDGKGDEAELARQLIDMLGTKGTIFTLDGLHAQVKSMEVLKKKESDFVIQIKRNQPSLYEAVTASFAAAYDNPELFEEFSQENKGHGRLERREVLQMQACLPEELAKKWTTIKSVIEVVSERCEGGVRTRESRWYISSLPVNAEQAAQYIRDHWLVENELHWVLDVAFREDAMKVADPTGAAHLALFNRVSLSVIKQHQGKKDSIKGKRQQAGWSPDFRAELIFG
ncbi:ISAs1 family transposase [Vibrio sp. YMD68]|uniref:ISAs1 family transposase n=1 Tax=Vibrio sp. YMD68 TaxID=3042300 RepID=UPI00249AC735|nr:ISAs1 family transposase [Vibrio sp. YMD68]WGW00885.1 ISAs1 family transposase [Vibrio sp. YMD68]